LQLLVLFFLAFLFLFASAFLTAVNCSLRSLHFQERSEERLGKYFFYRPIHHYFFPQFLYEGLLSATIFSQTITRFFYALTSLALLIHLTFDSFANRSLFLAGGAFLSFIVFLMLFAEFIPRIVAARYPEKVLKFCGPIASFFMLLAFPITFIILKLSKSHYPAIAFEEPLTQTKREIIEIIQRTRVSPELNTHEKKLIAYALRFKDRIAREVMVPRVDVFSLCAETSIKEAAKLIKEQGYSRIPVYRNSVDNIVGVLMYKDILSEYMKFEAGGGDKAVLEAPIEQIQKNVLYTPETQKISNLLLEFRKEQVHLAIVVDEYGGTEGIVTIEDILEEIVGEIEDEYDEEEELCFPQSDGTWIVDARMSILDVEQQLGIIIPQEGDYDTVGGYIFHCAGSIPSKGYVIHQEEFEMEILRSDERRVERVRVKSLPFSHGTEKGKLSEEGPEF